MKRLLLVLLLLAGCASGPAFQTVEIPDGKAVIYIYRARTMVGAALTPSVVINKLNAIPMQVGGYYPYLASPGELTVAAIHTGRSAVTIDVRPGETYYVRVSTLGLGIPNVEMKTREEAQPDLSECKRLPEVPGV